MRLSLAQAPMRRQHVYPWAPEPLGLLGVCGHMGSSGQGWDPQLLAIFLRCILISFHICFCLCVCDPKAGGTSHCGGTLELYRKEQKKLRIAGDLITQRETRSAHPSLSLLGSLQPAPGRLVHQWPDPVQTTSGHTTRHPAVAAPPCAVMSSFLPENSVAHGLGCSLPSARARASNEPD